MGARERRGGKGRNTEKAFGKRAGYVVLQREAGGLRHSLLAITADCRWRTPSHCSGEVYSKSTSGLTSQTVRVDTHGLTPVALAKEVCSYLEGCMPSNSL